MKIRLSEAQLSAIECRDCSDMPALLNGKTLIIEDLEAMMIWLGNAADGEDEAAENTNDKDCAKYMRRAAKSLLCIESKVFAATKEAGC